MGAPPRYVPDNRPFDDMMWEARDADPRRKPAKTDNPFHDPKDGGHKTPGKSVRKS